MPLQTAEPLLQNSWPLCNSFISFANFLNISSNDRF
jgi:hypothetical protein